MAITGLDSSVLLGFYQAQLSASPSALAAARAQQQQLAATTQNKGATAADNPPWNTPNTNDAKQDAKVLSTTNFLDTSKVPLSAGATKDAKTEQDNQKLFALYSAVNTLAYIAKMAQKGTATSGQLAGLNDRFQAGLAQVQKYLGTTSFNNFNLQAAKPSDTAVSTAGIAFGGFTYATKQLTTNANLDNALPGLSASDSFTIGIKKGGTTTNVNIDLSQVPGTLNLTNIVSYVNSQLSAAGFSTRFQKTQTGGTTTSDANATYGLQITPGGVEQVSLSASTSAPSLYLVGSSGLATETKTTTNTVTSAVTTTPADQSGRLTKLSGIDGTPVNTFSVNQKATTGTTNAQGTVVDASGNIIIGGSVSGGVIGAGQTAQGKGDAYLAKFDSKGKLLAESQFGTSGADSVAATAIGSDGSLYVASTQNGHAILAKYTNGDITTTPAWTQDLGDLAAGGSIGGLTVSGSKVYVSGATSNVNLTGGGASIAAPASGSIDAFVFSATDNGASASSNTVTYIGTSGTDTAGDVTVASDGTIYVTGSTTGTFAGAQRSIQNVNNAFATALNSDGTVKWTKQFGGADGVSTGAGLAIDTQGSSVLDALGLPRGAIALNQSVDLTTQTTLRAGDTFQIEIQGTAARTTTITIDQGETFDSLVTKINGQLGAIGKASVNYTGGGETLKLQVNAGNTINLKAGTKDFDALSRLGIPAGVLTAPAKGATATTTTQNGVTPTYGLGLTGGVGGPLDVSSKTGADMARSNLLQVLSSLQSTYQTTNKPPAGPAPVGNNTGTASAYQTAQLGNYNLALALLG